MLRLLAITGCAAIAAVSAQPARAAPGDPASAKAYVDSIYRSVLSDIRFRWDSARFAPELKALIDRDRIRANGEVGFVDAVPFCECQDTAPSPSFTSTVAATGTGRAVVTVALRNGGPPQTFRIDLIHIRAQWYVADIHGPQTPSVVAYLRKNLSRAAGAPARAGTLPPAIRYSGGDRLTNGMTTSRYQLDLVISSGVIGGTVTSTGLRGRQATVRAAAKGVVRDGQCNIAAGGLVMIGPCDANGFNGRFFDEREPENRRTDYGTFQFLSGSADNQETAVARSSTNNDASLQDIPAAFRAPNNFRRGNFDYIEGGDLPPEQRRGPSQPGAMELAAPQGTVWNYGRARWVIKPGARCAPAQQLWKGYCFGSVIAHMRRNPSEASVVAVSLSHNVPIGTYVGNDTPVRYSYIKVRRVGEQFTAEEERHGRAVVRTPQGCHFSPLKEGFVLTAPGPQGLTEAALFRCP